MFIKHGPGWNQIPKERTINIPACSFAFAMNPLLLYAHFFKTDSLSDVHYMAGGLVLFIHSEDGAELCRSESMAEERSARVNIMLDIPCAQGVWGKTRAISEL